jgi:AcrR family transcriptional regulator
VARTLDLAAHSLRRDEFIDAAQRLMQTEGYELMSVQDLLDELGASKGAFYHYFESKQALLEAVVDRMADAVTAQLQAIADDHRQPAPTRLCSFYRELGAWKTERKELLMALLRTWLSDDNAIVRDKLVRESTYRLVPHLATIIEDGARSGDFNVTGDSHAIAQVVMATARGMSEMMGQLLLTPDQDGSNLRFARVMAAASTVALERILGATPGSLTIVDDTILRAWYE